MGGGIPRLGIGVMAWNSVGCAGLRVFLRENLYPRYLLDQIAYFFIEF